MIIIISKSPGIAFAVHRDHPPIFEEYLLPTHRLVLVWLLATGPTLKETGNWINDTYNPRPGDLSYKSHGVSYKHERKGAFQPRLSSTKGMQLRGSTFLYRIATDVARRHSDSYSA